MYFMDKYGHVWGPFNINNFREPLECITLKDDGPYERLPWERLLLERGFDNETTEPWLRTWRERPLFTK